MSQGVRNRVAQSQMAPDQVELGQGIQNQAAPGQATMSQVASGQETQGQSSQSQEELLATMRACEGLDAAAIPKNNAVNAAWCLRFLRAIRDVAFATVDESGLPAVRIIDVMAVTPNSLYFLAPRGKAFHADVVREDYVAIVGQTGDFRTCRLRGRVVLPQGESVQHALVDALFELNPSMNEIYPGEARYICDVFCLSEGEGEYFDLGQKPIFRYGFKLEAEGHGEHDCACASETAGECGCFGKEELFGKDGCSDGNKLAFADKESEERARANRKGIFLIGDACSGCGTCANVCPEQCIVANSEAASLLLPASNLTVAFNQAEAPNQIKAPFFIDQAHCLRCGICEEICPACAVFKN